MAEFSKVTSVDVDGVTYAVSYTFNFIEHATSEERDKAVKEDPTSNSLLFTASIVDPALSNAGGWYSNSSRSFTKALGYGTETTMPHEVGHALGLAHAKENPYDPVFLNPTNGLGTDIENSGLMSYTGNKSLQNHEIKVIVQRAVDIAKTVNNNIVKVHLSGCGHFNINPKSELGQQLIKDAEIIGDNNFVPIYLGRESVIIK